ISGPGSLHADSELTSESGTGTGITLPGVEAKLGSSTEEIPIMVPIIPFDDDGELITATSASTPETNGIIDASSEGQFEDEQYQEIHSYDSITPSESKDVWIIKPKVTKDQAASMASKIVRGFRFNLELIPYYIFNYICEFESGLPEDARSSGMIGINGLTSNIEEWRGSLKTTRYLEEEHTKLDIKFPYDKALALVREAVIELNTKSIETREESDQTIIFEKKELKPKADAIEIKSKGLYYLPVWCIEGSNGLMIIDASTGKVIKEDFF
ncbi:MAG: hypothetical protein KAJ51_01915, partial [Thermoplasmata archaeon]|nr:hypothetical protein [Thermoplasmata archaeon]